jgi:protoheme IX farnesyltransferase
MARIVIISTIFLTFLLINLGGYVHNTGASLACPDWPLCYGQIMPEMKGGVLIEHSHRMLATLVGFLTILIVFFVYRLPNIDQSQRKVSWLALFFVVLQGLLGGLTVIYKLPTIISTSHLALSMIYFLTLVWLDHSVTKTKFSSAPHLKWNLNLKHIVFSFIVLVYLQMILGASIRHLGLGGACGVGAENLLMCFDMIAFEKSWLPSSIQAMLHMLHRFTAIFTFIFGLVLVLALYKLSFLRKYAVSVLIVLSLQVILGFLTVYTNLGEIVTTLHLGGAALLLALTWKMYLVLICEEKITNTFEKPTFWRDLFSLTKPRLSGLVVLTCALGLYLAPVAISLVKAAIAILSTALIVAGACAINCYMEKDVDKLMDRTKNRPLPSGRMQPIIALVFGTSLLLLNIPILYFYVNPLTAYLGLAAAIIYVFLYTPMKKKSTFALFIGAVPGAIPPLMGWTAATNSIDLLGLLLFAILFVWQLPHFLSIAMYYADDYKNADIKIVPNVSGQFPTKIRILIYTGALMLLSIAPFFIGQRGHNYLYLSLIIGVLFTVFAFYGVVLGNNEKENQTWAKRYFWGSLIYLPSVLILMITLN